MAKSSAENKRNNWTIDEDVLLVEALKKIHKKKTFEIKNHIEESGKISRTEKEIENRMKSHYLSLTFLEYQTQVYIYIKLD